MTDNPISAELRLFIAGNVHSVEQLEILCLLVEKQSIWWSPTEAFRHIQSTEASVVNGLEHFEKQGLAIVDSERRFRFSPRTSDLSALAADLVKMYRQRRVAVIETIYQKPTESAQKFADAFRLRKEK